MRVVDNPHCNHCQGSYETAAHFIGECNGYASLRGEIWEKPHLHTDHFQHVTIRDLVSFIGNYADSRRSQSLALASTSGDGIWAHLAA